MPTVVHLCTYLIIPEYLHRSDHHRMQALADHYTTYHPTPSWKAITGALLEEELHKQADEVTTKYVKGMDVNHVTCLILIQAVDGQLWYLISNQCHLITTIMMLSINLDYNSEYTYCHVVRVN